MDARSALFDLYGDHLRARGGVAPVAALVRLSAALGITAPAVRTAVSRMVRQDWLVPVRGGSTAGYALTPRAVRRLDAAAQRIYRSQQSDWDETWHVLLVRAPPSRAARERLYAGLTFLGYGALDTTTWLSPRASDEIASLLESEGAAAEAFHARYDGASATLAHRAWDIADLATAYSSWLADAIALVEPTPVSTADAGTADEVAFAARSRLVHEWRKFLFRDPGLPIAVLPTPWPGAEAAAFFDQQAGLLLPAAARFVDAVLVESR